MKKVLCAICCVLTLCFSVPHYVFGGSASWYFKTQGEGTQPLCCPEMSGEAREQGGIFLGKSDSKNIYLTFDAGFENGNVEKILDTLKEQNAPGAFFVLPHVIKKSTHLVERMKNEGHLICNHSKSHRDMSGVTDFDAFKSEIEGAEQILKEVTGYEMDKFYRPPEGKFSSLNLQHAKKLGYSTVFWSLAHADWDESNQPNPDKALSLLMSRVHGGAVVLLHPTSSTNAKILGDFIVQCRQRGYEFKSLADFEKLESMQCGVQSCDTREKEEKYVALTFDDGPHKVYTPRILELLDEYDAKATFFVIGKNAEQQPELVKREFEEGHEIGNHTYSHPSMRGISVEALMEEIQKTQEVICNITGKAPVLFRSPGGYLDEDIIKTIESYDCTPVLWSWRQDTKDWSSPPVKHVVDTVLNNIKDGDIILFHDFNTKATTPNALEVILPELKERGYSFVTVSQLPNKKEQPSS